MPMVNQLKNLFNMFQKIKKNCISNTTTQLCLLSLLYTNYWVMDLVDNTPNFQPSFRHLMENPLPLSIIPTKPGTVFLEKLHQLMRSAELTALPYFCQFLKMFNKLYFLSTQRNSERK